MTEGTAGAPARSPILVTGAHRSGTTWVGRILGEAPFVLYIHEPFSVTDPPGRGVCNATFRYWFTYLSPDNEGPFYRPLRNTVALRYDLAGALRSVRSLGDLRRVRAEDATFRRHRRAGSVALIKDPIALFSAEWLAAQFNMQVVVMIRHPAAFVSSIKRLNWSHPFAHFLAQPALMRTILGPFEPEIREYAARPYAPVDQAILLWRLTHHAILRYRQDHADWVFVRHEDLARSPLVGFWHLFARLHLDLPERFEEIVRHYSHPGHPREASTPIGSEDSLLLDSVSSVWNWKHRLTASEIEKVRQGAADLWRAFYSEEDW